MDDDAQRRVTHRYEDPLDRIWLRALARMGVSVRRSDEAYASTDGRGGLVLGTAETLDPDDCLAQMIFHELCHSLVQGAESFERVDWGLDNEGERDLDREHACLRVQATLARRHGLGRVLAPTTDHRAFYDGLGPDALEEGFDSLEEDGDGSVRMARRALTRTSRAPWAPHLDEALEATAVIARAVGADPGPRAMERPLASLWDALEAPAPRHPGGGFLHPAAEGQTCKDCAWQRMAGPGQRVPRCRQLDDARVDPAWGACDRFEAEVDCLSCGACCREAYQVVEVAPRDPFVARHPELVDRVDGRILLRRLDGRCPPLRGIGTEAQPFTCAVYEDRPRTCRDFERGGLNCLDARRRVGLSR